MWLTKYILVIAAVSWLLFQCMDYMVKNTIADGQQAQIDFRELMEERHERAAERQQERL